MLCGLICFYSTIKKEADLILYSDFMVDFSAMFKLRLKKLNAYSSKTTTKRIV